MSVIGPFELRDALGVIALGLFVWLCIEAIRGIGRSVP
jgi:hypothetical protein